MLCHKMSGSSVGYTAVEKRALFCGRVLQKVTDLGENCLMLYCLCCFGFCSYVAFCCIVCFNVIKFVWFSVVINSSFNL